MELSKTKDIKNMNKYNIIKSIMNSRKIDDDTKIYYIEMFIKDWYTEEDINWIWE